MSNLNRYQWPAPAHWEDFEDLCLDLWSRIWNDPDAQKNGRRGQAQHGVDVFGRKNSRGKYLGVQCKGKDNYTDAQVTKTEVDAEITKAEKFTPSIKHLTIATSAPQDQKIQAYARKISVERKSDKKFEVTVVSWDWIKAKLGDYPDLAEKHGYALAGGSYDGDKLSVLNNSHLEEGAFAAVAYATNGGVVSQSFTIVQGNDANVESLNAEIDYSKKLLNDHHAVEALHFLNEIEDRVSRTKDDALKFRLLTNKGSANFQLEKYPEASDLFIQALQYSQDEKALINASVAYLLADDAGKALEYAERVIAKNPGNAQAYSYKVQALFKRDKTSLEELKKLVPERHHSNDSVAAAFSFVAEQLGDEDASLRWIETAVANDQDESPGVKAELAAKLIKPVGTTTAFLGQLTPEQKDDLQRAIKLLDQAWGVYEKTETKRYKTQYVYNRALAKRLLDDIEGSLHDNEIAVALDPSNLFYKKHLTQLYHEAGNKEKALQLLRELALVEDAPEVKVMLAQRLAEYGGAFDEAVLLVESYLAVEKDPDRRHDAYYILLGILLEANRISEAEDLVAKCKTSEEDTLFSLILAGNLDLARNKVDDAVVSLEKAYDKIAEDTAIEDVSMLADELYRAGRYEHASRIYEKFIVPNVVSVMSRKLLNSYYRAGEHDKALRLCKLIREESGPSVYLVEMESSIYEDIGDLGAAEFICVTYLNDGTGDNAIKIRLAVIYLRQDKLDEMDKLIDQVDTIDGLALNEARQLVALDLQRGRLDAAHNLIYEARRKFFDQADVHLAYFGAFFGESTTDDDPLLNIKEAQVDTAVILKNARGETRTYIIENRPDPSVKDNEIDVSSPVAQSLLGKTKGETIDIGFEKGWKIDEIKSKYIYALHDSMNNFATRFPGVPGLWRFSFEPGGEAEAVKEILKTVDDRNEQIEKSMALYRQGKLTVGALGQLLGHSMVDTVYGLMGHPQTGLVASTGTEQELSEARGNLRDRPRLVVDQTAIIVLSHTGGIEKITDTYGKLLIPQSVYDELKQKLNDVKKREASGYGTIGKQDGKYLRDEVTPERVTKNINHLEDLLGWIKDNCETTPVTSALEINAQQRKNYADLLGPDSVDSVLLAKEDGHILLSDDQRLRALAKQEFNVAGIWTQALLIDMAEEKIITKQDYIAGVIKLPGMHYRHTRIDAEMLIAAAKEAEWALKYPYIDVVKEIGAPGVTEQSLVSVVTEFLYQLWKQPLLYEQRHFLVQYLLSTLAKRGFYNSKTLDKLESSVSRRFVLIPTAAQEVIEKIRTARVSLGA